MKTITRALAAVVTATLLALTLAQPVQAQPQRLSMSKAFDRCNGYAAADSVWIVNSNRVAFASENYPTVTDVHRMFRAGVCVALATGDKGMHHALQVMVNRFKHSKKLRDSTTEGGVHVTIMITRSLRFGWDISYVRR